MISCDMVSILTGKINMAKYKKGKDGKYHSSVTPIPGGKKIYYEARTIREMEEKRQQIIEEYKTGRKAVDVAYNTMIREWWEKIKSPQITNTGTRRLYVSIVNNHIIPFFSEAKSCRSVSFSDLQDCVNECQSKSSDLCSKVISILQQVGDYCVLEKAMDFNFAKSLKMPNTASRKKKKPLTNAQASAILDASAASAHPLLMPILYYTGCRCGEVAGLQWGDFDFDKGILHVSRQFASYSKKGDPTGATKTPTSIRNIPICDELAEILKPHRGMPNAFVISIDGGSSPILRRTFEDIFGKILFNAGIAEKCKTTVNKKSRGKITHPTIYKSEITPHWFRHNFATGCYRAGIPLSVTMVWLGHSSPNTTQSIYTDIRNSVDAMEDIDDRIVAALKKVGQKLDISRYAW